MKFVRACLFLVAVFISVRSAKSDLRVSGSLSGHASDQNVSDKSLTCNLPSCANTQVDPLDPPEVGAHLELALDGSAEAGNSSATVHAVANATIGKIGVGISGGAFASQGGSAEAGATKISASWTATDTFVSPSIPIGSVVRIYASLFLDGDISGTATGKGSTGVFLEIEDLSTFPGLPRGPYDGSGYWGERIVAPSSSPPLDILGEVPGTIRIVQTTRNGTKDTLGYRLTLNGGTTSDQFRNNGAGGGAFSADVSNSLRWGGIEKVTDEFDNLITDWTVTSDSGFDFSKPFGVPEPSSLVLVGIALCFGQILRNRGS